MVLRSPAHAGEGERATCDERMSWTKQNEVGVEVTLSIDHLVTRVILVGWLITM